MAKRKRFSREPVEQIVKLYEEEPIENKDYFYLMVARDVNLRDTPSREPESVVIKKLAKGTLLVTRNTNLTDEWLKVTMLEFPKYTGYVLSRFVEETSPW